MHCFKENVETIILMSSLFCKTTDIEVIHILFVELTDSTTEYVIVSVIKYERNFDCNFKFQPN